MEAIKHASEVQVSSSPWISGWRAEGFVPGENTEVSGKLDSLQSLDQLYDSLLDELRNIVFDQGANWILGLDVAICISDEPMQMIITGKGAMMENLHP